MASIPTFEKLYSEHYGITIQFSYSRREGKWKAYRINQRKKPFVDETLFGLLDQIIKYMKDNAEEKTIKRIKS